MEPKAVDDTAAGSPGDSRADGRDLVVETDTLRVVPVVLVKVEEELPERRLIATNESHWTCEIDGAANTRRIIRATIARANRQVTFPHAGPGKAFGPSPMVSLLWRCRLKQPRR
jgi:hypothetical protein